MSPADFVALTNQTLEFAMPFVTIEGELAEFKIRKNQWVYFKVKDDYASVDCFGTVFMLPGPLEDGMMIRVSGRPRLHERFGFSFSVQSIMPAGEGSLKKAFDLLKAKLTTEGLFDTLRKRSLPYPPDTIGVVTSAEGAAIGDFCKVLQARWPYAQVILRDALVQGEKAPDSVVAAIDAFNRDSQLADVLVIIRGGGSSEDLSAFNDERVVRAVAGSRIPTMVAIGHEQDESLAELAADARASTPSNAAEMLTPSIVSEKQIFAEYVKFHRTVLSQLKDRLKLELSTFRQRLTNSNRRILDAETYTLQAYRKSLQLLDPKHVLKRGYVIVRSRGKLIKMSHQLNNGQAISLQFYDGQKDAIIKP